MKTKKAGSMCASSVMLRIIQWTNYPLFLPKMGQSLQSLATRRVCLCYSQAFFHEEVTWLLADFQCVDFKNIWGHINLSLYIYKYAYMCVFYVYWRLMYVYLYTYTYIYMYRKRAREIAFLKKLRFFLNVLVSFALSLISCIYLQSVKIQSVLRLVLKC